PDDPSGCMRCRPRASRLCCDLCTPSLLADMGIFIDAPPSLSSDPLVKATKSSNSRSGIRKKPPTPLEDTLTARLEAWCESTAQEIFSRPTYRKHGPHLLLSDENLNRMVVCAQARKIKTVSDIARETRWIDVDTHGDAILAIIN
ncbi:hypothetical protein OF83DRAFT_1036194, partial [Amylostereum chailletii]